MSDDDTPAPTCRVTLELTAYLRHGMPTSGWYDMQTSPTGGLTFSIPQGAVVESSIRDAPPEQLTADDWSEIEGHVRSRLEPERADRVLSIWRVIADGDVEAFMAMMRDA